MRFLSNTRKIVKDTYKELGDALSLGIVFKDEAYNCYGKRLDDYVAMYTTSDDPHVFTKLTDAKLRFDMKYREYLAELGFDTDAPELWDELYIGCENDFPETLKKLAKE